MISPPGWTFKRPGILIPVFFLSLVSGMAHSQIQWQEAASSAMGGSFVCYRGHFCTALNQAGLGFLDHSSVSVQHSQPFLLKELGISSLSGQFRTGKGALGFALFTQGLEGFRQSSFWFSYGLRLHPDLSAGAAIHIWNSSVSEELFFAPGISFALGIQVRINEQWMLGSRLFHPLAWNPLSDYIKGQTMVLEAGFSYCFFRAACLYSELHIQSGEKLKLCSGLEWYIEKHTRLRTGISTHPLTFTWGLALSFGKFTSDFSFQFRTLSGLSPLTSLSYEW